MGRVQPGSPGSSGNGKRPSADNNEPHDPDWPHPGLTLQVGCWVSLNLLHPSCIRSPCCLTVLRRLLLM